MGDFVHLHLHSEYSLLDGACRIEDIPKAAKTAGHDAVAITDHGNMYGAVKFYKACVKEGIKPIIGCEVYVAPKSRFDRTRVNDEAYYHLVLLCENETGYRNLTKLVSAGFTEGFYVRPRIDMELLSTYHEGLIALSACLAGYLPRTIISGDTEKAEEHIRKMQAIFGPEHYYLELQNHGIPEQNAVNEGLLLLHRKTGAPLVATNDVHYLDKTDAYGQAVLMCIQTNRTMDDGRPVGFPTDEFYYKNTAEMSALFSAYPDAIANTVKIAERCHFDFVFGNVELPRYPLPDGRTPEEYFSALIEEGLRERLSTGAIIYTERHPEAEYRERIEMEHGIISQMGYTEYFLIVWDFIHYAHSQDIPVGPGRGSGAGSLIAFLLGITDIDPITYELLFERFLNPERVSMPDIDTDFCYERRDEVISYVRRRYGDDHVSQIVTFGTMAARAVVRDVGRALGMSYASVDEIVRLIPREMNITLKQAIAVSPELKKAYNDRAEVRKLLDVSMKLEGMPRHASTHAAGVVITAKPLTEYLPLSSNGGVPVTEYDMETVAELGLLKFDFLGLRYLTIISDTERDIRRERPDFDIGKIPLDDPAVYRMISSGKTTAVFQLESGGMRQTLMNMQPGTLGDIIAAIALYRPGPMDSIPTFIERKKHPETIVYDPPVLEEVLKDTYGCIVYQEQVMQVFRKVAGYSFGRADVVRRAMAKKKADVLEKEREEFLSGAEKNSISRETATKLFDDMASFANYAFNKSHAAAYGVVAYRTAYLKAKYPRQYYAAMITSVLGSVEKTVEYIDECAKIGIGILPPDVNESGARFTADGSAIRFSLLAIKGLGKNVVDRIVEERSRGGKYESFEDFIRRLSDSDLNKRQAEALIRSGAFDSLGRPRSQLLTVYEEVIDRENGLKAQNTDQIDLFSMFAADEMAKLERKIEYPDIPELPSRELLRMEKEYTGLAFSGHLLDEYREHLERLSPTPIVKVTGTDENPSQFREKASVKIAGIISAVQQKNTKNGDPMAFITVEDESGEVEVVVFPKVYALYGDLLIKDTAVFLNGNVSEREDERNSILAHDFAPLFDHDQFVRTYGNTETVKPERAAEKLYLRVPDVNGTTFHAVLEVLKEVPGTTEVIFYNEAQKKYVRIPGVSVSADNFALADLRSLLGGDNVILK